MPPLPWVETPYLTVEYPAPRRRGPEFPFPDRAGEGGSEPSRVPDAVFDAIEVSAAALRWSREEIIQRALERYLEDFDDLAASARRLRDADH